MKYSSNLFKECLKRARMASRGALIVFEGCDRCGKTTQCGKLVEALNNDGISAKLWKFPDRDTAIGKVINDYLGRKTELEDHAIHLLFTANRWEAVPKMKKFLDAGTTLVVDRYSYSNIAFTSAKENMDINWCKQPEIGLPKPDVVLYMTLSPEEAAKRASFGGERYEQTDFQKKVANNFQDLKEDNWKVIDANKSIEDLHQEIKTLTKNIIQDVKEKELGSLWVTEKADECIQPSKRPCLEGSKQSNGIRNGSNGAGDVHINGKTTENGTAV